LGQTGEQGAAQTELRSKYAEPGTAAKLIDLIEQVDDVKAELQPLVDAVSIGWTMLRLTC